MHITIIGLGLIGGSLAKDLRAYGLAEKVIGVESNLLHQKQAVEIGFVDCIMELEEAVLKADVVFLATPIQITKLLLPRVLDYASGKTVVDLCSTKQSVVQLVENHLNRKYYIAAHPMSGTEFNGPTAAVHDLFKGKNLIICDPENTDGKVIACGVSIFEKIGMKVHFMSAEEHDLLAAQVSHLSHVTSFALAKAVLKLSSGDLNRIKKMAAGGFHSTVRLAKSDPVLWNQIFIENKENVLCSMDAFLKEMTAFRDVLEQQDETAMLDFMRTASEINRLYED
jgi:prephenate dehydrogenase